MTDCTRLLDRGYTMMWREGRVDDALRGHGEDFEWVVPDQLWSFRGGRAVRMEMFQDIDDAHRAAGLA